MGPRGTVRQMPRDFLGSPVPLVASRDLRAEEACTFRAVVVGRRRADARVVLEVGTELGVEREKNNPADANALRVTFQDSAASVPLLAGYLARDLATVLAPLIDRGQVAVECMIAEAPPGPTAQAQAVLTVVPTSKLLELLPGVQRDEEAEGGVGAAGGSTAQRALFREEGEPMEGEEEEVAEGAAMTTDGPRNLGARKGPVELDDSFSEEEDWREMDAGPAEPLPGLIPIAETPPDPQPPPAEPFDPSSLPPLSPFEKPLRRHWDLICVNLVRASGQGMDRAIARGTTGEILGRNFSTMLVELESTNGHLMGPEELDFMGRYRALGQDAACLFVRLWQRKGPWVRRSTIGSYPEVPDTSRALAALLGSGLLTEMAREPVDQEDVHTDLSDRLDVLLAPELRALCQQLGCLPPATPRPYPPSREDHLRALVQWGATPAALVSPVDDQGTHPPAYHNVTRLAKLCADTCGAAYRTPPAVTTVLLRLQHLFFLNNTQDISRFLVTDLGVVTYPQYEVLRTRPVFASRAALDDYEQAVREACQVEELIHANRLDEAQQVLEPIFAYFLRGDHKADPLRSDPQDPGRTESDPVPDHPGAEVNGVHVSFLHRFSLPWIRTMIATVGVSLLEKKKDYKAACSLLRALLGGWCCPGRRGHWWGRLALDLEHQKKDLEALEVAEAALADSWVRGGDRLNLERRAVRLGKPPRRWRKYAFTARVNSEPKSITIYCEPVQQQTGGGGFRGKTLWRSLIDEQPCSVENRALQYYASKEGGEWTGRHSEGGTWSALFGLLMWDVLFAPGVPDVFQHRFQSAPLDLDTDLFYSSRQPLIDARLAELRADDDAAVRLIDKVWKEQRGRLCRGLSWDRQPIEELKDVARCLGGKGLAAILEMLAVDHESWTGGMPDLVLWRPRDRRAKLSEVKSTRDRLSEQQRAWILAMEEAGIDVEVCRVLELSEAPKGTVESGRGGRSSAGVGGGESSGGGGDDWDAIQLVVDEAQEM